MLGRMTFSTQNLDIFRVIPFCGIVCKSVNMVPFKFLNTSAFLAFPYDLNFLPNNRTDLMRSRNNSSFPLGMIFFLRCRSFSAAFNRTIFHCSFATFSTLKRNATKFTNTLQQYLGSFRFNFCRTGPRTCVSFRSNMCVRAKEFVATSLTFKGSGSAFFNMARV